MESNHGLRPAPEYALLIGSLLAAAGYVLPWFRPGDSYAWSYSGWGYASLSTGGGWTLITFAFLTLTVIPSLWAGRYLVAAMCSVVGVVGSGLMAVAVIAASFSNITEKSSINYLPALPFGIGLPLLATGLAGSRRSHRSRKSRDGRPGNG